MKPLNDDEYPAIMALQSGSEAPTRDDPVWLSLVEKRLVWLDYGRTPPDLVLTPLGWRYPGPS